MKKILIATAAMAATIFTACDGTTQTGGDNDSICLDSITIEERNVVEAREKASVLVKRLAENLQADNAQGIADIAVESNEYINELLQNGDKEAVKAYVSQLKEFIDNNKEYNLSQVFSLRKVK